MYCFPQRQQHFVAFNKFHRILQDPHRLLQKKLMLTLNHRLDVVKLFEVVSSFLPGVPDFSLEHQEVTLVSILLDSDHQRLNPECPN